MLKGIIDNLFQQSYKKSDALKKKEELIRLIQTGDFQFPT